jgi:hypothetical protein
MQTYTPVRCRSQLVLLTGTKYATYGLTVNVALQRTRLDTSDT